MIQTEQGLQPPLSGADNALDQLAPRPRRLDPFAALIARGLNRDLPHDRRIEVRVSWPLWLIPLVLLNQLLAPHVVWVVVLVALCGFYAVAYLWVRHQTPRLTLKRRRIGAILVAGDMLQEEFEVVNGSHLPLLWAEFIDASNVPEYAVGRVVACEGDSLYRWRTETLCQRRGVYRLGPHLLRTHDPLGLFRMVIDDGNTDIVVIYPRVVHLPPVELPRGNAQGGDRRRSPLLGSHPAATVSDYQRGDSLRFVHWASTARRGRLMVKDLEIEPSGNIWLVLDLDARVQQGTGNSSTLEQGIVVAASLAAELLSGHEQRAVGLLAYSGASDDGGEGGLVEVIPGVGSAHTWPILSALAPVSAGPVSLGELLASSRGQFGRSSTLTVITSATDYTGAENGMHDWVAELVRLHVAGVKSSVVLVAAEGEADSGDAVREVLARMEVGSTVVEAGVPLPALLTFRRRRRVVRSTPTGGAISYEVDEEVG